MVEAQALGFVLQRSPHRHTHFKHLKEQLTEPSCSEAKAFLDTWRYHHGLSGMIVSRHFPTRRWSSLLPNVALLEKARGREDFHVRLVGFALFCFYGIDLRGKNLSEVHAEDRHRLRYSELSEVLASGRPHISRATVRDGHETLLSREILSLPVLASDGCTRLVLVASFWRDRRWLN